MQPLPNAGWTPDDLRADPLAPTSSWLQAPPGYQTQEAPGMFPGGPGPTGPPPWLRALLSQLAQRTQARAPTPFRPVLGRPPGPRPTPPTSQYLPPVFPNTAAYPPELLMALLGGGLM